MSDFQAYMNAKETSRAAEFRRDYATAALELAKIYERLAEIKSQHEPLDSLINGTYSPRDRLYAAAHYVVYGRILDLR